MYTNLTIFAIIVVTHLSFSNLRAQTSDSILIQDNLLSVKSQGIAFLGSGITESDAKIIATNDAKRKALEQSGMYLESNTKVINYTLVKDEIISISGSILKTNIIAENRKIINNMFAYEVKIETSIDLKILNERITYLRKNRDLEEQLNLERERNKKLAEQIKYLNQHANSVKNQKVKDLVNALTASEWNRLGLQQENISKKIDYFTKAINLDANYVTAFYNRGSAYNDLEDYMTAIRDFDQALELNPEFGKAYNNRGVAQNNLGRYEQAIQDFDTALKFNPYLLTIFSNRGAAYHKLGKYDQAIRDFNKAIELNPDDALVYSNRGIAYNDLGQHRTALQDFTRVIGLSPQEPTGYYYRGSVYLQLKMYHEALADYSKVIDLNPQDATPYKNRAMIYTIIGQNSNAAVDFNLYLKLDDNKSGDAAEIRRMIKELE
jgi:tetratricopeptide (TPR) repeat protein